MPARRPLYFLHVPKTAGLTVRHWLDSNVEPGEYWDGQLLTDLAQLRAVELQRYTLFWGHFGLALVARLGGDVDVVTVLREPRARTVSHIAHIRRDPFHYLHERSMEHATLESLLADSVIRLALTDFQARYLGVADPFAAVAEDNPFEDDHALAPQIRFELSPLPPADQLYRSAAARLRSFADVGTTDRLDEFARRVAAMRGWDEPATMRRDNSRPADDAGWTMADLSPEELSFLDDLNTVDLRLYVLAVDWHTARSRAARAAARMARGLSRR